MPIKKFLIQIESAENTRWLANDGDIAEQLQATAEIVARANTSGTEPRATVTVEEAPGNCHGCPANAFGHDCKLHCTRRP